MKPLAMGVRGAAAATVLAQGISAALGLVYIIRNYPQLRFGKGNYTPGIALGTSVATYSSQNYGAKKPQRLKKGIGVAILLYGIWWIVALLFVFLLAPAAVHLITGSENPEVIANAVRYLRISIPMMPPMMVLVILRNALQGMKHSVSPLICSTLELAGKVVFALWIVPAVGYFAVCICEPVTWVICCIFIVAVCVANRMEFL